MTPRLRFIAAMLIFGSIGLFVRGIPLPSSTIAFYRSLIGSLVLLLALWWQGGTLHPGRLRRQLPRLVTAGGLIGLNWIFLFEAYGHTSIPKATFTYYLAPVLVIFLAALVLKERITLLKLLSLGLSVTGLFLILAEAGFSLEDGGALLGIGYGLLAAVLYASVIILNKTIEGVGAFERTLVQLAFSGLVLLPYVLLRSGIGLGGSKPMELLLLLLLGVVHTGGAYYLYFSAMTAMKSQSIALLSYVDPISAVLFSAVLLREPLTQRTLAGGALILFASFFYEWNTRRKEGAGPLLKPPLDGGLS